MPLELIISEATDSKSYKGTLDTSFTNYITSYYLKGTYPSSSLNYLINQKEKYHTKTHHLNYSHPHFV